MLLIRMQRLKFSFFSISQYWEIPANPLLKAGEQIANIDYRWSYTL